MKNLYVDMDGVLTDFNGQCKIYNIDLTNLDKMKKWRQISKVNYDFWETMTMLSGVIQFWMKIETFNPIILSAPMDEMGEDKLNECIFAKKSWLSKYLGDDVATNAIIDSNKAKYCKKNDILIDDYLKYINPWIKAGGIGIHHKGNLNDTYKILCEKMYC